MMRFVVIVGDVVLNSFIKFKTIISRVEIHIVVLDGFPEPFDPDIIQGPPFSIHGYQYALQFEELRPQGTGVLSALIGVDDCRFTVSPNGVLQYILTPLGSKRVADAPSDNFSAIH